MYYVALSVPYCDLYVEAMIEPILLCVYRIPEQKRLQIISEIYMTDLSRQISNSGRDRKAYPRTD